MTKARKAVQEILGDAGKPLCALDMEELMGGLCDLATIYRSLHYMEKNGLAESFVLHCSAHGTERYYVSQSARHRHWFHCERCHGFVDLGACKMEPLLEEMEKDSGVEIRSHMLYATGVCASCAGREGAGLKTPSGSPRPL
ncbi:MAG: transcriptional repressor [Rectinemataceae bacterium]|nr:transcriptional repressor [Rectinemataceae bacterium]